VRFVLLVAALACGCSYTFDANAPDLPLVGGPPNMASFPRINRGPAGGAVLMDGWDGETWAVFRERPTGLEATMPYLRLVRLGEPAAEEVLEAEEVIVSFSAFFIFDEKMNAEGKKERHLVIRSPGEPQPWAEFSFPGGEALFIPGGDQVFIFWLLSAETKDFLVQWRDGSFSRRIPVPAGVDPADPGARGQFQFTNDLGRLITRDAMGEVVVHSTRSEKDTPLGKRPHVWTIDYARQRMVTCGQDGIHSVPLDGTAEVVLDTAVCDTAPIYLRGGYMYFYRGGNMWRVKLDGTTASEPALDGGLRPLFWMRDLSIVYSLDPGDRYAAGAGDGWLNGWRFMERGRNAGPSIDGKRMRWLEHAAKPGGIGELLSAPIGGEPLILAHNVRLYEELADGRVLANSNRAFRGAQNRVIVIDEEARESRWVADMAADYVRIPGKQEILVDVISGPTTYDIVRVPIPPK
jgi:hypothetical protein